MTLLADLVQTSRDVGETTSRLAKVRVAFDMLSVSCQLGLMPAAGGRAESALAMAQRSASRVQQAIRDRRGN